MDNLLNDLRYALRSLRQTPAFAGVVVVTLALGIGANSAIFSVVNGVLLRPLPYPDADRIVQLNEVHEGRGNADVAAVSGSIFRSLVEEGTVFEHLAMYSDRSATLTGRDAPVRLSGSGVSPSLFPLLRTDAMIGRTFSADEAMDGADRVAVLSHRSWQRYFGGDPSVVGERILLDDEPHVVVGVMPPGFEFPEPGIDYWVPLANPGFQETEVGDGMRARMELLAPAIGRLRDGVTIEQAVAETTAHLRNRQAALRDGGPGGSDGGGAFRRQGVAPGGTPAAREAGEPRRRVVPAPEGAGGDEAAPATEPGRATFRMVQPGEAGAPPVGEQPGEPTIRMTRPGEADDAGRGGGRSVVVAAPGGAGGDADSGAAGDGDAPAGDGSAAPQGGLEPRMEIESLQDRMVGEVRPALLMLMGAVGFVLLIACANVANLVMARSGVRTRETAVRAALGAGGFQLVRLLLVEGLLLAFAGGALGLGLAWSSLRVLMASPPEFIPRVEEIGVDLGSIAFTLAVAALTGLLFSLLPARSALRLDLTRTLKEGGGGDPARLLGRDAARKVLVAAEVALSVVLLVGAGLLVTSFVRLATVDPGFDADNILDVQVQLSGGAYESKEGHLLFLDRVVQHLAGLPGVTGVAVTNSAPSFPTRLRIAVRTEQQDREAPDQEPVPVGIRLVDRGFLDVVRARLVEGRLFTDDDRPGGPQVAIMSRAAAEGMYPGMSAVGQRLRMIGREEAEIVGVVENFVSAGTDPEPQPEVFLLYGQASETLVPILGRTAHILVRTAGAPLRTVPAIQGRLPEIVPGAPAAEVATVADMLADEIAEPRFYAGLVGVFAALAVVLAAVGIYGVLSYSVQQRIQETAIRRALGARPEQVLLRVVRQGMLLAVLGLAVGLVAAAGLTRILGAMLYEIESTDPLTYAAVAVLFLAVSLAAVWLPARRATRIDPMRVLRYEA